MSQPERSPAAAESFASVQRSGHSTVVHRSRSPVPGTQCCSGRCSSSSSPIRKSGSSGRAMRAPCIRPVPMLPSAIIARAPLCTVGSSRHRRQPPRARQRVRIDCYRGSLPAEERHHRVNDDDAVVFANGLLEFRQIARNWAADRGPTPGEATRSSSGRRVPRADGIGCVVPLR